MCNGELEGSPLNFVRHVRIFLLFSGGLFCGTVLFRLFHIYSKRKNMEVLTTLLVILTVIQPFICLHPVIIWSQDSNQNSTFLLLIIFIWFLPICVHVLIKAVITPGIRKCKSAIVENETPQVSPNEHLQLRANHKLRKPSKTHHSVTPDANTEKIDHKNTHEDFVDRRPSTELQSQLLYRCLVLYLVER